MARHIPHMVAHQCRSIFPEHPSSKRTRSECARCTATRAECDFWPISWIDDLWYQHGGTFLLAFTTNWQGSSSKGCGLQKPMILKPNITNCWQDVVFHRHGRNVLQRLVHELLPVARQLLSSLGAHALRDVQTMVQEAAQPGRCSRTSYCLRLLHARKVV